MLGIGKTLKRPILAAISEFILCSILCVAKGMVLSSQGVSPRKIW